MEIGKLVVAVFFMHHVKRFILLQTNKFYFQLMMKSKTVYEK